MAYQEYPKPIGPIGNGSIYQPSTAPLPDSVPVYPAAVPTIRYPAPAAAPHGCICPPTSEQTCQGPMCPRRAPRLARVGKSPTEMI